MTTPVKYDSNKDIIKGSLMVFLNRQPLAFEKTSQLDLSADSIDISNKMTGEWSASAPGKRGFSISSEALVTRKEGSMSYDTLVEAFSDGTYLDFVFATAIVTDKTNVGGAFEVDETKPHYKGSVWINSLGLSSNAGELSTCSANFTGTGSLDKFPKKVETKQITPGK